MTKIPVTNNFVSDFENTIGMLEFAPTARASFVYEMLKMKPDSFSFEIGYKKNPDGTLELTEISLVNKYSDNHPIILKRRLWDKVRVFWRRSKLKSYKGGFYRSMPLAPGEDPEDVDIS